MSNKLPLSDALKRLAANEEKFEGIVNGAEGHEEELGGKRTPSLRTLFAKLTDAAFTSECVQRACACAKHWALQANKIATEDAVIATGSTEARTLPDRFADVVNVKDFGAKGDGLTDDTEAWNAWQIALSNGGVGYIPAGDYFVNGVIRHFVSGCFGNGDNWTMTGSPAPDDSYFMSNVTNTGPILQYHRDFNGIESWSPLIDVSFDSVSDKESPWTVNGAGAQGIQVRGTIKGVGNSHPNGVRALMLNELNGDGDCVALWGRVHKQDPEGGVNNSDSCAIHAATYMSGQGEGICMATEHWAYCDKEQGAPGTEFSTFFDPGGIVCQHIIPFGRKGMVQACQLFNCSNDSPYGTWAVINMNNNLCKFNGSTVYPANTAYIKAPNLNNKACPEAFMSLGWCPKHVKMTGGYDYNIYANYLRKYNNTVDTDSIIAVTDQWMEGSSPDKHPVIGFAIYNNTYGGTPHAPSVGGTNTRLFDLYYTRGNANIFYRALAQPKTHHVFYSTDSSGDIGEVLNVFHDTVRPGRDNDQQLGDSTKRWSNIFAGTSSISTSDERVKDNISDISNAVLDAWANVNFSEYQFKDAISKKGKNAARLHTGVIAQRIIKAFSDAGLDAERYGLVCHDSWDDKLAEVQQHWVEDEMEQRDDDGNLVKEAVGHWEEFVSSPAVSAGDLYSVRYEEALCMEAAYQRRRADRLEARIAALEAKLK